MLNRAAVHITGSCLVSAPLARQSAQADCAEVELIPSGFGGRRSAVREPAEPDFETQIPRAADRRAMGPQFQYGVFAAGEALLAASMAEVRSRQAVGLFVCTRQGERSEDVDRALFARRDPPEALDRQLNDTLMGGLRPTLFLAQIPNLLAGNIAIVHGVTGESRTFIGEELAGVNAVHAGTCAVTSGRLQGVLVGGALNARRENIVRWMGAAGAEDGLDDLATARLGTASAFLVLEASREGVAMRARSQARLTSLLRRRLRHDAGARTEVAAALSECWRLAQPLDPERTWVLSNAPTSARRAFEADFWNALPEPPARVLFSSELIGSTVEADAPAQIALAVRALQSAAEFDPVGSPAWPTPRSVLVLTAGLEFGLGAFLVEQAQ